MSGEVKQFELLKKSAVTQIQADLEAAVEADRILAQTAASTSVTKAGEAAASSTKASQWAENPEDVAVEAGQYSALHWAAKATAQSGQMQAIYPVAAYKARIDALAEGGVIKYLDRLTELYMNQLNLLPYTHFMWDGNAGYKVVDGKLVKAYDMSPNGNDGTTSSGTEPFAGGLIAPNESVKIKNVNASVFKSLAIPQIARNSTQAWTISLVFKNNNQKNASVVLGHTSNECSINLQNDSVYFTSSVSGYTQFASVLPYNTVGKNNYVSLRANGDGTLSLYVNGVLKGSNSFATDMLFNAIANYKNIESMHGELSFLQIITKSLSAYEIQLQHELLRLQHPEIEGIDIGNQHWATSNYEGVVTGNGTVIPEYQYTAANSPELIDNGDFATSDGWFLSGGWSISGGKASNSGVNGDLYRYTNAVTKNNHAYKLTYTISDYVSGSVIATLRGGVGTIRAANGTFSEIVITTGSVDPYLYITGDLNGSIDNVSVKEAGWDELTTPGWCYYNNDAALGAVYGKKYNKYAIWEIAKNPPAGWRAPSKADYQQLIDYLGGSTVAGKKLKALFGTFNNSNATNESGFSALAGGIRTDTGAFGFEDWGEYGTDSEWTMLLLEGTSDVVLRDYIDNKNGMSLRLLRNSPVGEDTKIISTGRFATDISVNPKILPIAFGYKVENIVINSTNALTGVTASLYNYSDALQNELLASTSVDANIPNIFDINSHKMLLQDGYVKVLATGNTGDGMTIDVVLKKIQ